MKKYKQTVIPEVSSKNWIITPAKELRNAQFSLSLACR